MNTRPLTDTQHRTLIMIKDRHKEHPITGSEIMVFLDIKDKDNKAGANLRSIINALRDKGYPICACARGYYYPQNPDELREYIDQFQGRIDQQQTACNELKNKLKNWAELIEAQQKQPAIQPASQEPLFNINNYS